MLVTPRYHPPVMVGGVESRRAVRLAARLEAAGATLGTLVETIDPARWAVVPGPGVWSVGKDAAHVAEAAVMHQWMVRRTIGQRVPSRRPGIERRELTTRLSPGELGELIRVRTREGADLLRGLTDAQLELPTRPPRAGGRQLLAETIERVLIGHYETHRAAIEGKLAQLT